MHAKPGTANLDMYLELLRYVQCIYVFIAATQWVLGYILAWATQDITRYLSHSSTRYNAFIYVLYALQLIQCSTLPLSSS